MDPSISFEMEKIIPPLEVVKSPLGVRMFELAQSILERV